MNSSPHHNETTSTAGRFFAGVGVLAMATGAFVVGYVNPAAAGFFPACPFHALTGLNCPGCGLTRGFHALFNGDVLSALHFNALLPVYFLLFLYLTLSLALIAVKGRGLDFRIFSPAKIYAFLILTLIFAIVRNLPFYPFASLII